MIDEELYEFKSLTSSLAELSNCVLGAQYAG